MLYRGFDNPLYNSLETHVLRTLSQGGTMQEALRQLSPLSRDSQIAFDNAVLGVGTDRLVVAADIMAAGLTTPLSNPMGTPILEWRRMTEHGHAIRVMNPQARGEFQRPVQDYARIPIYITMDDFHLDARTLAVAERTGQPLDTIMVEQATRNVNESIEDAVINGADDVAITSGLTVPGLLNAPNATTIEFVDNQSWTDTNHSGDDILADVQEMVEAMQANKKHGPYRMYMGTAYGNKLTADYKSLGDKTIRQRLLELDFGGGPNLSIRVADKIPADTVIMVNMDKATVDILDGMRPTVVSWTSPSGWDRYWAVMAFIVPRVRDNYADESGIVIGVPND